VIHLFVLGPLDIRDEAGSVLDDVPSQPKRAAVLAFLAAATPRGYHRRDTLLGLFWPDLEQQRARRSLNTAISYLRGKVGKEAIVRRGGSELALSERHFWCDVWAFDDAIRDGRFADALDLYRGDLLEGFFISGAPEFEHWLDRERARRRQQASDAAWALAERAETEGDADRAARWARRAASLTPHDEATLRRLMALLERNGDRAGALREFEEFSRRLYEELETEPSARTRELADQIRARSAAAGSAPGRAPSAPSASVEPSTASPDRPPAAAPDRPPAAAAGAPGPVRPSREREALPPIGPAAPAPSPRAPGAGRSRRAGRTRGSARIAIGVVALILTLATLAPLVVREGGGDARRAPREDPSLKPWSLWGPTTPSVDAFAHYRAGRVALAGGDFAEAVAHLREAVAIDTTFALAYMHLSFAADWAGDNDLALWAAERAAADADRMEPWKRATARAWRALLRGDPATAERMVREVISDHVDPDAYHVLAEVQFHWKPTLGESALDSRAAWERTLTLRKSENGDVGALIHLVRIAAGQRDTAALRSFARRVRDYRLPRGGFHELGARALAAFAIGDESDRREILNELATAPDGAVLDVARSVAVFAHDLDGAAALARLLAGPGRDPFNVAWGAVWEAQIAAARGDIHTAAATLRAADALPADRTAELVAALALAPLATFASHELAAVRQAIERSPDDAFVGPGMDFFVSDGIYPPRREYLLGQLGLRLGDLDGAHRIASRLERTAGRTRMDDRYYAAYARVLRAEIARACGRPARALEALGQPEIPAAGTRPDFVDHPLARERWLRAELLHELGRDEEALAWYATFPDPQGYDLAYLVAARIRQAEIHAARGDAAAAARYRTMAEESAGRRGDLAIPPATRVSQGHPVCAAIDPRP